MGRRAARSQRLQPPLLFGMLHASRQKFHLQRLLLHLPLQRRDLLFLGTAPFPPPAIQRVLAHFIRSRHLGQTSMSIRRTADFLNSVNLLRDKRLYPILFSLRIGPCSLSHFWGPLQNYCAGPRASLEIKSGSIHGKRGL